ncbi:MAG TPA: hypothetical protein PK289_02985 [Bacteroidia bacterium]|nr:hypothetical protein [Bacteroidia bacterium]
MKYILFLAVIFFISCQQEPKEELTATALEPEKVVVFDTDSIPSLSRTGPYYPLWYKESLTTDNYLLYQLPRKQEAYNKAKVDSVYMVRQGTATVNINGITHGFYEVKVKFKGEPTGQPALYLSVLNGNNLAYIPYGVNVLHSTNQYKVVTLIRAGGKTLYTDWHLGRNKNKLDFNIYGDTTLLGREYLFGSTPTGTMFTLPHK